MFSKPLLPSTKLKANTSLFWKWKSSFGDGFSRARVEYCNIYTDVNETGFSFIYKEGYAIQGKFITWQGNFRLNFTNREAMSAMSVFRAKFNVKFSRQVLNLQELVKNDGRFFNCIFASVADSDLELSGRGRGLACPAGFYSFCDLYFS